MFKGSQALRGLAQGSCKDTNYGSGKIRQDKCLGRGVVSGHSAVAQRRGWVVSQRPVLNPFSITVDIYTLTVTVDPQ